MGILYETLEGLAPEHDAEMLAGYQRYESLLAAILTPEQMRVYADYLQITDVIRIFDEMTPDELAALPAEIGAIATAVMADTDLSMENRRVVALLNQRGEHDVAPDLGSPSES
jgi:hypothetical protein